MIKTIRKIFDRPKPIPHKGGPLVPEKASGTPPSRTYQNDRKQTFAKVFRYTIPDGQMEDPKTVEIVGSFTHWQRVPLLHDSKVDGWHATIHHIQGNRTHHYMLLVDGKPALDHNCDGLSPPVGPQEERYQLDTDNGPRVLMLFAQTR